MNDNRNTQFPGQPPGNMRMMQSQPGFVPQAYPMMQQPGMMGPVPMMQQQMMRGMPGPMMQQPRMFPMQGIGMRPNLPPPSYNQALNENYRQSVPGPSRQQNPLSPNSQKRVQEQEKRSRQFQEQQQRLKNFSKGAPKLDANTLIDSMFGKTEKTTSSSKNSKIAPEQDDGFGDFLGGPSIPAGQENVQENQITVSNEQSMVNTFQTSITTEQSTAGSVENSNGNNTQTSSGNSQVQPKEEKKDLMSMMLECSDLSAPQKAKTFHKPSLKELHPTHHHHQQTFQQSQQARHWEQGDDLSGIFIVEENQVLAQQPVPAPVPPQPVKFELPAWCNEDDKVPNVYTQVLEASTVDGKISTDRLYPILVLSGLPKDTLGQIWSLANQTTPGQLIKPELYLLLALIAFAQNNVTSLSVDMLRKCPQPPVPFLGQQQNVSPPSQAPNTSNVALTQTVSQNGGFQQPVPSQHQPYQPPASHQPVSVHAVPTPAADVTKVATFPTSPSSSVQQGFPNQSRSLNQASQLTPGFQEDDDFADFQEAPVESFPASSPQKKKLTKEPDYLYCVPKPDELPAQLSPGMSHSNVCNFFGSDDSSVSASPQRKLITAATGASTPNSLDEDFDDFKSADSKPSDSSQFTSSEQSENEDFKVLESYLDDFNHKKTQQEIQQESPLHRPLPKFTSTQSSQLPSSATLAAIPPVRNLWMNTSSNKKDQNVVKSDLPKADVGLSPPETSDSDFADFQQAPVPPSSENQDPLKASKSETCLIGEEDKYAALRVFEINEESKSVPSVFGSSVTQDSAKGPPIESEEDSWADFQAVSTDVKVDDFKEINTENSVVKTEFSNNTAGDWSSFSSSSNVEQKEDSDWSAFGHASAADTNVQATDWSNFSQGDIVNDDWASFKSSGDTEQLQNPQQLVEVKKQNLQASDIMGMFKVKDNPIHVVSRDDIDESTVHSDSKPKEFVQSFPVHKTKKLSSDSDMDDDPFRIPPPMDDVVEEEDPFGDFSRGYDLDEVVNTPKETDDKKKNLYNFYGMELPSGKPTKSISEKNKDTNIASSLSTLEPLETDFPVVSSMPNVSSNTNISEDSQSTSSLEMSFSKGRVSVVKDLDSQSISSNEFGNFETHQKSVINPESKSVDSLDLKKAEEQIETIDEPEQLPGEGDGKVDDISEFTNFSEPVLPPVVKSCEPLPVLGDRYSSIMHDIPGSDKHVYEWQRCLENCLRMIKDSNDIFNSISSSVVCNEVIKSEQGSEYVRGIVEIYRVVCRITSSINSTALTNDKLKLIMKNIDLAWNNLAAFLVGGNLMPDDQDLEFKNGILKCDDTTSQYRACGVCLLDVDAVCKDFDSEENCAKLTYGGRQYHAVCANFWVNSVDSMLPALKLPELL